MSSGLRINKKQKIIIGTLLILCVLVVVRIFNGPYIKEVDNFTLTQDEKSIHVTWKVPGSAKTWIMFYDEDFLPTKFRVKGGSTKIPVKKVPKEYKVAILSLDGIGLPRYSSATIYMRKVEQQIEVKDWKGAEIEKTEFKIQATAKGKISYTSSDPEIAEVGKDGKVKCKKDGIVMLTLKARKGDYYKSAMRRLQLRVFPDHINTPALSAKNEGARVKLSWKKVKYADKYRVMKYDKNKNEYVVKKELDGNSNKYDVWHESSTYKVVAKTKMAGKEFTSEPSEAVEISSPSDEATTYKNPHTIEVLTESKLKKVARITPKGNASVAQSFCYTGKKYIVSLVSKRGKSGKLVEVDEKGKTKKSRDADIGFGNGSTYNPNTGKLYSVRNHGGELSKTCKAFEIENDYKTGEFKMPMAASGIAYDEVKNKYYFSGGEKIVIANNNLKKEKEIKKIRYKTAQDIGAHDGVILVTVWKGRNSSYIDLYREKDSAYIGSYDVPIGEIESVLVVDKHLALLMHNTDFKGERGEFILMTKDPVKLP